MASAVDARSRVFSIAYDAAAGRLLPNFLLGDLNGTLSVFLDVTRFQFISFLARTGTGLAGWFLTLTTGSDGWKRLSHTGFTGVMFAAFYLSKDFLVHFLMHGA